MSLSSRKSKGYNRPLCKMDNISLIVEQNDNNYIDEHEFDSYMRCECSDCVYDMGRNYMGCLVAKLEKLSLISKDAAMNFWQQY